LRRDQLGGERNVVEQVGQLAGGLGMSAFLVKDVALEGGHLGRVQHVGLSGMGSRASNRASVRAPRTRKVRPSLSTDTVPSWSVRQIFTAAPASRPSVDDAGWPYRLRPELITAAFGRDAASNASPVEPALPWCPTLSRSRVPTLSCQSASA